MASSGFFGAFLLLILLFIMPFGLLMGAIGKTREAAARSSSTNNLKQIGLAMHTMNDSVFHLPFNGGHTNPEKLKAVNYGWHNPNIKDSGTWATMILPYLEQEPMWRNTVLVGTASNAVPAMLTEKNNNHWQAAIRTYICPGRARLGFKTDTGKDCYPGILTDYAVNVFLNSPPKEYSKHGFAVNGGVPIDANTKVTIQGISDGSSNTVLVGSKALPPSVAVTNTANLWDEGIFSPGNYQAGNDKSTITSTGTGRGHLINPKPPAEDAKTRPAAGGVPWMYRDTELAITPERKAVPAYDMDWGGPFSGGVLFLWGDGTVRSLDYKVRGTVNFARMLYPSDGQAITFD